MLLDRLSIFLASQPSLRVLVEQFFDQISEDLRCIFGEPDHTSSHQVIEFSFGIGIERREASVQLIEYHSVFIPISHAIVPFFVDNFKGQISGGSAKGTVEFVHVFRSFAETEIC